jgi:GxxExxY protein
MDFWKRFMKMLWRMNCVGETSVLLNKSPLLFFYETVEVGHYIADMVINDLVILEIKAVEKIIKAHDAQLLNYLRSTNIEVGLVLNFGPKPEISRKIYETTRHRKPSKKS